MARRILLADDSVTAQNMGRRILHDAGYEVTTVNNGSAALKKIAEQKPDLIILDVYMPGYGGLEVCSRLKENRDTQRIPVLLTVGKLEPFKPEEARRVRADAYIVKPFEASELLSALTKLEDKIVPAPEPHKPGRFAKAVAAAEEEAEEFGDKETGWKNRLIIPGKKTKQKEREPEPETEPAKSASRGGREEDFRPAEPAKFERPIPGGLPEDISAEEIAAIAAAAAKINGKSEEGASAPAEPAAEAKAAETKAEEPAQAKPGVEAAAAEAPQAAEPAVGEAAQEEQAPSATFASAPEAEQPAAQEVAEAAAVPEAKADEKAAEAASAPAETVSTTAAGGDGDKHPMSDAEVLAALAALTPAGGDFSLAAATQSAVASSASGASLSGPRWVAESVALSDEESTLILEHEMEKAYAAFAAAEAGRALMAQPVAAVSGNGNGSGPAESATAEPAPASQPEAKAEEATPAVAAPMVDAVATEAVAPAKEEALAAAAGAAGESVSEAQPVASTFDAGSPANGGEEGSLMRDAELAAAWANWRQIRESIVGEQAPVAEAEPAVQESAPAAEAPPAEPVSQEKAEDRQEQPAAEEAKAETPETPSSEAQDPAEISSIVDNMLAELKPKLMEELKRKLKK